MQSLHCSIHTAALDSKEFTWTFIVTLTFFLSFDNHSRLLGSCLQIPSSLVRNVLQQFQHWITLFGAIA